MLALGFTQAGKNLIRVVRKRVTILVRVREPINEELGVERNVLVFDWNPLNARGLQPLLHGRQITWSLFGNLQIVPVVRELDVENRRWVKEVRVANHEIAKGVRGRVDVRPQHSRV